VRQARRGSDGTEGEPRGARGRVLLREPQEGGLLGGEGWGGWAGSLGDVGARDGGHRRGRRPGTGVRGLLGRGLHPGQRDDTGSGVLGGGGLVGKASGTSGSRTRMGSGVPGLGG
jgi:hypothetical protein